MTYKGRNNFKVWNSTSFPDIEENYLPPEEEAEAERAS
jgi:hypothetical protein